MSFEGKVVFATGAGSGIGRATAVKLASMGATLFLTDINLASVEETVKLCAGSEHQAARFDVGSSSEAVAVIRQAHETFDRLDFIFNCAGRNPTSMPLITTTDEYFDTLVNTNLRGMYNVTRAAIPFLQSGAAFVNVSSIAGIHASPGFAIYNATKFGVIGFSKSMALELGPKGIRVNIVAPGYINTPTNAGVLARGDSMEKMAKGTALGRVGTPEEIADVVAFLFSEDSRYMNGSVVEVEGGLVSAVS